MKAMILAAGRGERMRPLTDTMPKPLLPICGTPIIEYHVRALVKAGFTDIVVNHAHLGDKIETYLGDGKRFGANIQYSVETEALETGGGIFKVLPFFDNEIFLVVNGDVWSDFDFSRLPLEISGLIHLVMINNPAHNPDGDFYYQDHRLTHDKGKKLTYSGIGLYNPALFNECEPGKFPLAPLLRKAIEQNQATADYYQGFWMDIGTPERLELINRHVASLKSIT